MLIKTCTGLFITTNKLKMYDRVMLDGNPDKKTLKYSNTIEHIDILYVIFK